MMHPHRSHHLVAEPDDVVVLTDFKRPTPELMFLADLESPCPYPLPASILY